MQKEQFKTNRFKVSIKGLLQIRNGRKKSHRYPCLCESINFVIFISRLLGTCPIISLKKVPHISACKFGVSRPWMIYSYTFQIFHIAYASTAASLRLSCGPNDPAETEWYVMTFGYFISDINVAVVLATGVMHAKDICSVLEKMTTIPGPIGEMKRLRKIMKIFMVLTLGGFIFAFISFSYVAWIRLTTQPLLDLYCHMLDKPLGVMIRGSALIFPGLQTCMVTVLCLLLSTKFQCLADKTTLTLEANFEDIDPHSEIACTVEENIPSATNQALNQLAETHRRITDCLRRINKCLGLLLLSEISANLYTIVYYLYRYCIANKNKLTTNDREKVHYVIALGYRIAKLLTYITLGHIVSSSSNKPLEALQRARIINLPTRLQQQVQTLLLQWSGTRMGLSAFGIFKVGPWLIAPIVGNIITYLLVALQFEKPSSNDLLPNVTALLETIF